MPPSLASSAQQAEKANIKLKENRGRQDVDLEEFAVSLDDIYRSDKLVSVNDGMP